jgi:hypothetical protein
MKLKVYVAGKVSSNSVFGTHDWRDAFCAKLSELSGIEIVNLDPTKADKDFDHDQGNPKLVVGRDSFMIKQADVVIVNLTDDISVGGSQEMLIAKYFNKPLVGIAPRGGKFRKTEKELYGRVYKDWIDPFASYSCDAFVENIKQAANFIKTELQDPDFKPKGIETINQSIEYYQTKHHENDTYLH